MAVQELSEPLVTIYEKTTTNNQLGIDIAVIANKVKIYEI